MSTLPLLLENAMAPVNGVGRKDRAGAQNQLCRGCTGGLLPPATARGRRPPPARSGGTAAVARVFGRPCRNCNASQRDGGDART